MTLKWTSNTWFFDDAIDVELYGRCVKSGYMKQHAWRRFKISRHIGTEIRDWMTKETGSNHV